MYGIGIYGTSPYGTSGEPAAPPAETLTEALVLADTREALVVTPLVQAFSLAEVSTAEFYALSIHEALTLPDISTASGRYTYTALEALLLNNAFTPILAGNITDTMATTGPAVGDIYRLIALLDSLALVDNVPVNQTALLAEALALAATQVFIQTGNITDATLINSTLSNQYVAYSALLESLVLTGAATGTAIMSILLTDELDLQGDVLTTATFFALLEEQLALSISLVQDGVPYLARTVNTETKGVTEYVNYPFNSFAVFDQRLYGAADAGLFLLEGEEDNGTPIDAYFRTALKRIAGGHQAHVDSAYLGYSSDGTVQLKTITTEKDGSKRGRVYELNFQNAAASRAGRIKMGKGVQSAYWAFEVGNVLGSDFTIDVIEMHVLALSRRL